MSHNSDPPPNIYDDPRFFARYRALRQSDIGLNGAIEVPALRRLLPSLRGHRVLDLGGGCGRDYRDRRVAPDAGRSCAIDRCRAAAWRENVIWAESKTCDCH